MLICETCSCLFSFEVSIHEQMYTPFCFVITVLLITSIFYQHKANKSINLRTKILILVILLLYFTELMKVK